MKLIIAGSRDTPVTRESLRWLIKAIYYIGYRTERDRESNIGAGHHAPWPPEVLVTEVVSGMAHGGDQLGLQWAVANYLPWKPFPADWEGFGRQAGPIRNRHMAEYADALVAIWDGKSRGTGHMIGTMRRLGKPAHVLPMDEVPS